MVASALAVATCLITRGPVSRRDTETFTETGAPGDADRSNGVSRACLFAKRGDNSTGRNPLRELAKERKSRGQATSAFSVNPWGVRFRNSRFKWRGQDLNLRPRGYEPRVLPDCSTPRQYRPGLCGRGRCFFRMSAGIAIISAGACGVESRKMKFIDLERPIHERHCRTAFRAAVLSRWPGRAVLQHLDSSGI